MKIGTEPIPAGKLAMIAIQVRYISFTAPPTHRSLASRINQDRFNIWADGYRQS